MNNLKKTYRQIEQDFISFFVNRGYTQYDAITINSNDNNTFFTIAGMKQFIDYFLQKKVSSHDKIVNSQPCIRLTDLHNNTSRHTSMFIMLGLFRFDLGFDKKDIIQGIYDFYSSIGIDMNRIYITVHEDRLDDYESACSINNNKVIKMLDNFWSMGTYGPCGTCVEFYYNYTDVVNLDDIKTLIVGGGSEVLEIGNIVFIDQTKTPNGTESLGRTFVDTGLGLSRISQIINGKDSVYETDIYSLKQYIKNKDMENPIIDAIITSCFIMKESVAPGPDGRHYVLRKILRKALFYERDINIIPILHQLYEIFGDFDFLNKQEFIQHQIQQERDLFAKVIEKSSKILSQCSDASSYAIANHTHGVPIELIEIHVKHSESMMSVINVELDKHKQVSAKNSNVIDFKIPTNTCFYDKLQCDTEVMYVEQKDDCTLILTKDSCFYPTSGGQQGDKGLMICADGTEVKVDEARKQNITFDEFIVIHKCQKNDVKFGDKVHLKVDQEFRQANTRAHSALHIFAEQIMRDYNACQVGSYVCNDYARIDLSIDLPAADRVKIMQKYVDRANECISKKIDSVIEYVPMKSLSESTLYDTGVSYGDIVRRMIVDGYSNQLCGGTHVKNVSEIKKISLRKVSSIGAGKTRIEIVCGDRSME